MNIENTQLSLTAAVAPKVWSAYQERIFGFCTAVSGAGNAVVEAVAGSGKTTTLVEAVRRISARSSSIFLAFNKAIANELASRGVNARTFHSLVYGIVLHHVGARTINTNKLVDLVRDNLSERDVQLYKAFTIKLVGLARQLGIGCLVPDQEAVWCDLAEHHDLELDNDDADYSRAIDLSRKLLQASYDSDQVDFDDLMYVAVRDGLTLPKFDFVFVDEAQDTNAIQRAILRKVMHTNSRLIAVGDPAQAIYGFRGADSDSLDLIAQEFNCTRLPLTVSYRCPTSVVEYARTWVSHIQPAPGAPAGTVSHRGTSWKPEDFVARDLIVCRTTKPLISTAYQLLRARVPAKVMGREVGRGLTSLINKMRAKGIDALVSKLQAYTRREVEKAVARGNDAKAEAVTDRTETILFMIDTLPETDRTIPNLVRTLESMFTDDAGNTVVLATIHKAKGLEADRVYWLNSSKCPSKWAKKEWQQQQERNLCYVAVTRARGELITIEDSDAQPDAGEGK